MYEQKIKILNQILGYAIPRNPERLYSCPKCESQKKKLSVNVVKNVFKCWLCDFSGNDLYFLVKKYGDASLVHSWPDHTNIDMSTSTLSIESLMGPPEKTTVTPLSLPKEFKTMATRTQNAPAVRTYLHRRGLTDGDITKWKIGYCPNGEYYNRIVIPSFDCDGNLNYFVARSIDVDSVVKYRNPKSSKDIIFNDIMINWDDDVVLVEGVFDAVKIKNSIPLLGSTLNEDSLLFNKIVTNNSRICLALDNDAYNKSLEIYKKLSKYGIEVKIVVLEDNKDIGEYTKEKAQELYSSATDINTDNYLMYEIMKI